MNTLLKEWILSWHGKCRLDPAASLSLPMLTFGDIQ